MEDIRQKLNKTNDCHNALMEKEVLKIKIRLTSIVNDTIGLEVINTSNSEENYDLDDPFF